MELELYMCLLNRGGLPPGYTLAAAQPVTVRNHVLLLKLCFRLSASREARRATRPD